MRINLKPEIYILFVAFSRICCASEDPSEVEPKKPSLQKCMRLNPCGATLSTFPLLESDVEESSGFGSGTVPVYDEILTHEIYDLNATPERNNFTLCTCPDDAPCDFEDDSKSIRVDPHVTLRFCDLSIVSSTCGKNNAVLRVIGNAHETGESVQDIGASMAFCNCPNGFTRKSIEAWGGNQISLNYKCL